MATTRVGLKPSCTLNKSQKLRSRRPAATIRTRERANSPITKTWRRRERCREPLEPRPSCRSVVFRVKTACQPRGGKPEDGPGGDRDEDGKRQHAPANGYVIEARQAFRNKLQQKLTGRRREPRIQ